MKFTLTEQTADKQAADCVLVGVYEKGQLSTAAQQMDARANGKIAGILQRGDLEGKPGQTLVLYQLPDISAERVMLVGLGKPDEVGDREYRDATAKAIAAANGLGCKQVASYLPDVAVKGRDMHWKLRQAIDAVYAVAYRFDRLKSKPNGNRRAAENVIFGAQKFDDKAQSAIAEANAINTGMNWMRDLGNLPGNICTPGYLAEQAQTLQKDYGMKTTVLEMADMEKLGMGALLAVARGSREPAKLITIEYRGGKTGDKPVALVGKGVTFDSGGISIKPAANMDEMKFDMSGAASVLGTLKAAAELKLPLNIVGVIPTTENLPGGRAIKPGDIVTSLSGQTIEILNTDAEGRLILCDALTYTERFEPAVVIDIATLTGACVIALGHHASGLFTADDALADTLLAAGNYTGDRAWRMPLWDDYQKQLDSNFADMANVGGREGGAITAACFLWRYTKKFTWAHLDIAGTAWKTGKEKGSTGRPVPLLVQYLLDRAGRRAA